MKKSTLKNIFQYIRKYTFHIILSLLLALLTVSMALLIPVYIGKSIDCIIGESNVNFEGLKNNFLLIIIFVLISSISQWFLSLVNNKLTYDVTRDIRKDAMHQIQQLPLSYIDTHPYGDIVSKIISDVDTFADGLLMGFTQLFSGIITILGTLVFMLKINWIVALFVVFLTPISLFVARFIATRTYRYFKDQSIIRGQQTAFIDEMIHNLKVVQAFSHEEDNLNEFDKMNATLETCSLKAIFISSLVNPSTRFINALIYAFVALSGAFIILKQPLGLILTIGNLTTLLSYANQYTKPFNEISGVITELQNAFACFERIYSFIEEKPQSEDDFNAYVFEKVQGELSLNHVSFSYTPSQTLLQDLNLHVTPGQKIAIVGPTGCGKTTLINLLMRFYDPKEGSICVDNTNTLHATRASLRKNFGMVLQETWLKSASIRENIKMGNEEASEEQMIEACKASHAHSFIKRLKNGYDTIIGEDGGSLSAGQKQLLCIARIMLLMPPMLILDEATSSIDTRTEIKIQEAFNKLMENKTSFIVAHRLSTIKEADIILVMKDGNIIEMGNHASLLNKKGFYYSLYNSQFES